MREHLCEFDQTVGVKYVHQARSLAGGLMPLSSTDKGPVLLLPASLLRRCQSSADRRALFAAVRGNFDRCQGPFAVNPCASTLLVVRPVAEVLLDLAESYR